MNPIAIILERKIGNHERHEISRKSKSSGNSCTHPSGERADSHNSLLFRAFSCISWFAFPYLVSSVPDVPACREASPSRDFSKFPIPLVGTRNAIASDKRRVKYHNA